MDTSHLDDASVATDRTRPPTDRTLDGAQPAERSARWRRRLPLGALTAVLVAAAAVAVVVALKSSSPSHASNTGVPAGETTTTVTRRTLSESATEDGTLSYKGSDELFDRLSEAGTFTWLPAAGDVVRRGGTLFRVNNLPVLLMYGVVPAYRTLKQGVGNGPDVNELNRNLKALGFDPYDEISKLDRFTAATAAAVKRWQKAEGLEQTGEVELGRVDFAPSAQRIAKIDVSLGEDPPGDRHHKRSREHRKRSRQAPRHQSKDNTTTPEDEHGHSPTRSGEGSSGSADDAKDVGKTGSKSPASKGTGSPEGGGGAGMLVLSTTSTEQIVQLEVKAGEQQLAHVGESAPVTLPSGRVVKGRITEVGRVASESGASGEKGVGNEPSGNGENATVSVTLKLDHPVTRLDEATVSVELVKSVSRNVLAVPATALAATAGGGYAIEALEHDRRVELPVTPGMFANSYVQVEGAGVEEGLTVVEAE